jgi:hypothetical protein
MTPQDSLNCEKLRRAFDGREAIYVEKGVLRVRVTNISFNAIARQIGADVEEILTPGLERSLLHRLRPNELFPLRWQIGAGRLTRFSEHTWAAGYGSWSLFFAPEIVSGVVSLAAAWSAELDAYHRYRQATHFLMDQNAHEPSNRVFPD